MVQSNLIYGQEKLSIQSVSIKLVVVTFFVIAFLGFNSKTLAQGISSGATFNWSNTQSNYSDPANLESVDINGTIYNTFVVPSTYEMTRVGPGGHQYNHIWKNGTKILDGSNNPTWDALAIEAYQSLNLNHYFESDSNGDNFCEDFTAAATTDAQVHTLTYNPGIPSNQNGILAVTERGGNNCQYLELYGIPVGGGAEQLLGKTFVRTNSNLRGIHPQTPPVPGSDYWTSGRNYDNGQVIGIGLFTLSDLAPVGSIITSIKYFAATQDNGDGKFFLMQSYAVDDTFDTEYRAQLDGDVSANDNVPANSTYTLLSQTAPFNGDLTVNPDGTFTYIPDPDIAGTDTFEIQVCLPAPNELVCNSSMVTVTVKPDNLPTANNDDYTVDQDDSNRILTVLDNDDFGLDGPQVNSALEIAVGATNGSASVSNNGTSSNPLDDYLIYTPNPGFYGNDEITYRIIDANGTEVTALARITVDRAPVEIAIDDATALEGNSISFTISSSYDVPTDILINLSYTDITTEAGDYNGASTITFPANSNSVTVNVLAVDDDIIEPSEDFEIQIATSAAVIITDDKGIGSITDNDAVAGTGISFQDDDITVDEAAGTATLNVLLTGNVAGGFTLDFATADDSASAGDDYAASAGQLAFAGNDGELQPITVTINDDDIIEATERLFVDLSNLSTNLIPINDAQASVSITDNDGDPTKGIAFDITGIDVNEDVGTVTLNVVLNANVQDDFTVDFNTSDGTAIHPNDFTDINGTLTFGGSNSNNQSITLDIIDDIIVEDTENLQVVLSNISTSLVNILSNDTVTINIIDNDGNEGWPVDITLEACDTIPDVEVITIGSACTTTVNFTESIAGQDDGCAMDYTITRTWTFTDCVGNIREHTQVITIIDTQAPSFVEALPTDIVVSCDNVPQADVITAIDSCDPNITVVFDEQITDNDACGSNYVLTRTWNATDCAGNPISHTQVITVEDNTAPAFVQPLPQDMTVMCNEVPEAAILTALDNCNGDTNVAFDEVISNDSNCAIGYTITRTWSTEDCAGNTNVHSQTITIAPTGPIMASDYEEEVNLICGDEIPEIPQLTFTGGCGNYEVTFEEDMVSLSDTEDFMITRIWDVMDSCGNTATFEQVIFIMQPQPEVVEIDICVEDDAINLIDYLPSSFDSNGTFEVILGNTVLNGSTFDPANLEVGEYLINYISLGGTCKYYVDFNINVNSDCVPCGRDEIIVSNTVTANGDNINDMFTIEGVEYCNYSFEVMIFNRWGDKVYESSEYQDDWGGYAPNNAFGNSGMLPSGTYYYIINVKDTDIEPLNGYIYLGTGAN